MRKPVATYGALAAAVTLACGMVVNAQEPEELTEAEEAQVERQTEEIRQDTEQLEQQTEQLEEETQELQQQNEDLEQQSEEISQQRTENVEERSEGAAEQQELNQRRDELVRMAEETIDELRQQNPSAAELYDQAYGYAVFDTTKGGLIVTGAGGTGVAMQKDGNEPVFMHLGQAGVGLGAGLENYRLVMLLEDEQTYDQFVSGQWDGSISAQASAGEEGVSAEEQFVDGVRAYRLTDAGLMAQVDVSSVRFWPSEELNEVEVAEADDADPGREDRRDDADRLEDAADEAEDAADQAEDVIR